MLELFHFALNPGGLLFLGTAETADWLPELFTAVDKRNRIYRAKAIRRARADLLPMRLEPLSSVMHAEGTGNLRPANFPVPAYGRGADLLAPGSVLVDAQGSIVYISGTAARYLSHQEGVPSQDLLELVRPELRSALAPALLNCLHTGRSTAARPVRLDAAQEHRVVQMSARPNGSSSTGTFSVHFEEFDVALAITDDSASGSLDQAQAVLEEEIRRLREQLSGSLGDSASSNQALRASNEELQSINEELRSATEELATSKEELQSVNEELTTVNFELKSKMDETAKTNDDLTNLIVSMDIATVFVDRAMRIQRFTPRATEIFSVRATDAGRPLQELFHQLQYTAMGQDVEEVLKSLHPLEREVSASDGRWFIMRVSPYRTAEDRIVGVVLNFIDITERRRARSSCGCMTNGCGRWPAARKTTPS